MNFVHADGYRFLALRCTTLTCFKLRCLFKAYTLNVSSKNRAIPLYISVIHKPYISQSMYIRIYAICPKMFKKEYATFGIEPRTILCYNKYAAAYTDRG